MAGSLSLSCRRTFGDFRVCIEIQFMTLPYDVVLRVFSTLFCVFCFCLQKTSHRCTGAGCKFTVSRTLQRCAQDPKHKTTFFKFASFISACSNLIRNVFADSASVEILICCLRVRLQSKSKKKSQSQQSSLSISSKIVWNSLPVVNASFLH